MADGYARASGGLGVCFGIGGPGILNMATALTAAGTDLSSVLAISGEVARAWEGMGGFQDASGAAIDDIDVLRRITGMSVSIESTAVVPHHLRHAITHAMTRHEPAHLSIPVDIQKSEISATWQPVPAGLLHARFVDRGALAHRQALPDPGRGVARAPGPELETTIDGPPARSHPESHGAGRALYERMASVRAQAEGRPQLGDVYARMFNNLGVTARVSALGEQLRFHGVLPSDIREMVILRYAARQGFAYEWSHHQRPARLAGLSDAVIEDMTDGRIPASLTDASQAVLAAVDAVCAKQSIPDDLQRRIVDAHGYAGAVELVVLCGLYAVMGYMCRAFDIEIEEGLPSAPF